MKPANRHSQHRQRPVQIAEPSLSRHVDSELLGEDGRPPHSSLGVVDRGHHASVGPILKDRAVGKVLRPSENLFDCRLLSQQPPCIVELHGPPSMFRRLRNHGSDTTGSEGQGAWLPVTEFPQVHPVDQAAQDSVEGRA